MIEPSSTAPRENHTVTSAHTPAEASGARCVEVAAMLGDSVVGVKHVSNPRGGKISGTTYGLYGFGAVLLIISLVAFISGVSTAAENHERFERHVEEKRPAHEFRPLRVGLAFDWMAIGGSIGGLLCLTMAMMRSRDEKIEPVFRIGRASGVDFPTEASPVESFPLVAPVGDDFVFNFSPAWQGELTLDGQITPLAELVAQGHARPSASAPGALEMQIPHKARIRVTAGNQTFLVSSVPQPRRHAAPLFASLDTEMLAYLAGTAIILIGFVKILDLVKGDQKTLYGEELLREGRLAKTSSQPRETAIEEEPEKGEDGADAPSGTGSTDALESGTMGDPEAPRPTGHHAIKNQHADPQIARTHAIEQAREAGVLGLLSRAPSGAFSSLTATADFSSALDDRDVYGGLLGSEVDEATGSWGYGITGIGQGFAGTSWGTIGTSEYGIFGGGKGRYGTCDDLCQGKRAGYGSGDVGGGLLIRKASPPQVKIGTAITVSPDKEIIRRYIRTKLARIRHCYEKELLAKPELAGTVVTQFQISPAGTVQGASAAGMGDSEVESCVAAAIGSIQFPKPAGGGYVNVRYPFTFQPAGG